MRIAGPTQVGEVCRAAPKILPITVPMMPTESEIAESKITLRPDKALGLPMLLLLWPNA